MLLGYNTNGLAHHDPEGGLRLLAETGYESVAITLDHDWLNPFADDFATQIAAMRRRLDGWGLRSVVETGARFLLDPFQKHEPTLVSPTAAARARRVDFLCRAIDVAHALGSDCVSLWSGVLHNAVGHLSLIAPRSVPADAASVDKPFDRLVGGLRPVLDHAARRNVVIGFEPEPGMFIDTMARFAELLERIDAPHLRLTLDIGHLHCLGETPIADFIRRWGDRLVNVHIEDMRRGVHEHLPFGEGEIDFPPVLAALAEVGYNGGLHVELSRHSHAAPTAARAAHEFLSRLMSEVHGQAALAHATLQ
jgi:L-ribulose-5-phosphate 3-epimerase